MLSFKLRPLGARLIPNRISITAKVFSLKTVESSKMSEVNGHGRPVVELFVKAALDKMRSGGCPICHRYFMIFYILREKGLIDLIVTTFLPENPPKEILEFSNGKHYPLVKVTSGVDRYNKSLAGVECDTVDEIETLVDRFDCEELRSTKESRVEAVAEQVFDSLYTRFNQFLRSERDETALLLKALEKVESYLSESRAKYLVGDTLHKADCYLLPTLQHIRVAGKAYRNFEIPSDFEYIWTYLKNAYNSDAFSESCPADREIVSHYNNKVLAEQKLPDGKISLMGDERTFSIPLAVGGRNSN